MARSPSAWFSHRTELFLPDQVLWFEVEHFMSVKAFTGKELTAVSCLMNRGSMRPGASALQWDVTGAAGGSPTFRFVTCAGLPYY